MFAPKLMRSLRGIALCTTMLGFNCLAQDYPNKPIRMLVGFSVGGGADISARVVSPKLSQLLGQQVVVENRPGAGGTLATARAATSPPDGYTLLMIVVTAETALPALQKLPYDLERDLAPVSLVSTGPIMLVVHPSVPSTSTKQLIALARSRPGKLNFGHAGVGSGSYLAGELFKSLAKVDIVPVPYKGAADAIVANAGGEVDMTFAAIAGALPLLESGKVRAIAVTSKKRASLLASVPTLDESGLPGCDFSVRWGVLAPAGVRKDIIALLNSAIAKAVSAPDVRELFNKQGMEPQANTPEEFATLIRQEIPQSAKLINKLTQ